MKTIKRGICYLLGMISVSLSCKKTEGPANCCDHPITETVYSVKAIYTGGRNFMIFETRHNTRSVGIISACSVPDSLVVAKDTIPDYILSGHKRGYCSNGGVNYVTAGPVTFEITELKQL